MRKKRTARQRAIIRRNVFFISVILALALIIAAVAAGIRILTKDRDGGAETNGNADSVPQVVSQETQTASEEEPSSAESAAVSSSQESKTVSSAPVAEGLDPAYTKLLLVNGENPLPEDYDYEGNLTTIPDAYINGSLKQIDKDVWPYMKAMIDAAWKDGVRLYVWSPYRSYNTQNMLFQKQVNRQKTADPSLTTEQAEKKAATVVAHPGTSEHHTGLAADFNMADDKFETTAMYEWMKKHAEEYGFIMRYAGDKQEITGVIHESWHWRFVGINVAKEINRSGLCLEEYLAKRN